LSTHAASLHRSIPADPGAPRVARNAVKDFLNGLGADPGALSDVLLAVSEVVTNCVVHAGTESAIGLNVEVDEGKLRVDVSDASAGGARLRPASGTGGYGLSIVDALSSRWGTAQENDLNVTWFELDVPSPGERRANSI